MPLAARFFLELAVGLVACLPLLQLRPIGSGFARLMALFALLCLAPTLLITGPFANLAATLGTVFGVATLGVLAFGAHVPERFLQAMVWVPLAAGVVAVIFAVQHSAGDLQAATATAGMPLMIISGLDSALVLGLVTGAMILGHWYLVTPELPVAHLGRLTRFALIALYAKLGILLVLGILFADQFQISTAGLAAVFGLADSTSIPNYQDLLNFIFLLARIFIGLIGPAILCHMTLATVKLEATQPATGILYAATAMVLMGELCAFPLEPSFQLVL